MNTEKEIACKLRQALDTAYSNHELDLYYPFNHFPYDCCEHTCDILGYLLSRENIETVQVNGQCIKDLSRRHVWLLTQENIVIDITESQFANDLLKAKDVEKVRVGTKGPAQHLFSLDIKYQPNTNFTDPSMFTDFDRMPSPRQKRLMEVLEILQKYL